MARRGATARGKGNAAERAVAKWLRGNGWPEALTTRDARGGAQGGADICGVPGWSIEVKDRARASLAAWWTQTIEQADACPLLVWHQPGVADPGGWVAICRPGDLRGPWIDTAYPLIPSADWPAIVKTGHVLHARISPDGERVAVARLSRWAAGGRGQ